MSRHWTEYLTALTASDEAGAVASRIKHHGLADALDFINERYADERSKSRAILYAALLLERGVSDEAVDILTPYAEDTSSGSFGLIYLQAKAEFECQREESAEQLLSKIWANSSKLTQKQHILLGEIYEDMGQLNRADRAWEAVDVEETDLEFLIRHAELKIQADDLEGAKRLFEAGVSRQPSRIGFWQQLAKVSRRLGELKRALEAEYEYLKRFDGTDRDWMMLASDARQQGCLDIAEKAFETLIKRDPFTAEYRLELGYVHLEKGKFEEAISKFEMALQKGADAVDVHLGRALAAMELGDLGLAGEVLGEPIFEKQERLPPVYSYLEGRLHVAMGRFEEALESLRQAKAEMGDEPDVSRLYTLALLRSDEVSEALSALEGAIEYSEEPFSVLFEFTGHLLTSRGYETIAQLKERIDLQEYPRWSLVEPLFELTDTSTDTGEILDRFEKAVQQQGDQRPLELDWSRLDRLALGLEPNRKKAYENMKDRLTT